jgi:hypothetical protein
VSTTDRWEELFGGGRRWRVAEEVSGTVTIPRRRGQPAVTITFTRGNFTVAAPGAYQSPLSTNKGRTGVLLVETDDAGAADYPGTRMAVGAPAVKRAREKYGAIW